MSKFLIFFLFFLFSYFYVRRLLRSFRKGPETGRKDTRRKREKSASLEDSKFNIDAETVDYEIIDEPNLENDQK